MEDGEQGYLGENGAGGDMINREKGVERKQLENKAFPPV